MRRQLDADIADLTGQVNDLKSRLATVTLSPERIADIHEFAARVRKGMETIDSEFDFAKKRKIINLLDVKIKLAVFNGQQVVHATCILNINAPQELPYDKVNAPQELRADYTSSKRPK